MHELSLALALLEALAERVSDRPNTRVTVVYLRIGPLAGVVESALQSAFEIAALGTCAEGARLVIERTPLVVRCCSCHHEQQFDDTNSDDADAPLLGLVAVPSACPSCGAPTLHIIGGDELELVAAEVVHGEGAPPHRPASSPA